ncbi:MAG: M20/M25/M40 family metallo-hydrolase [Eubacteriales bacterium]
MKLLFEKVDLLLDEYVEFLIKLCNIESKSDDKEGLDRVCGLICAFGREKGYEIKPLTLGKAGNIASLTYNPGGKGDLVCVSAHMDTVFDKGEFGYPPVTKSGDILRGPGVIDCKGGIAVSLLVMEALKLSGYDKRPVKLILQSDEEVESALSDRKTLDFMLDEARGAAAFFNCEGRTKGFLTTGRKGIIRVCLDISGRAAHAGDYFDGASAIREAAFKIIDLEEKSVKDGITYNCGVIKGGTALNVVPDSCKVYIDIRVRDENEFEKAMREVEKTSEKVFVAGTKSKVVPVSHRKPMVRTKQNADLFGHINGVSKRYGFGEQREFYSNGGSDAAYTTLAGIPTVDDIGPVGGKYHTKDEWCSVSSVGESAKLIAASIIEL